MINILNTNDKFYCSTIRELCFEVFEWEQKGRSSYFLPKTLKKKFGTTVYVWCESLDGSLHDLGNERIWSTTLDKEQGIINKLFCGNSKEHLADFEINYRTEYLLVFDKIKSGNEIQYFQFVGVFLEDDFIENKGVFIGKRFKKVSDTFKLN